MKNYPAIPWSIPSSRVLQIVRELSALELCGKKMFFDVLTSENMARQANPDMTLEKFLALCGKNMQVRVRVQEEPVPEIIVAAWIDEAQATHFLWLHIPLTEKIHRRIADIMEMRSSERYYTDTGQ